MSTLAIPDLEADCAERDPGDEHPAVIAPALSQPSALLVSSQGGEVSLTTCDRAGHRTLMILSPDDAHAIAVALFNHAVLAVARAQAAALNAGCKG